MCPSDLDALAEELSNYARSFREIGDAFVAASEIPESSPRRDALRRLERELAGRPTIGLREADLALLALVGLLAGRSGESPRTILEAHFAAAPTDADWRALLHHHRREENDGRQGEN